LNSILQLEISTLQLYFLQLKLELSIEEGEDVSLWT